MANKYKLSNYQYIVPNLTSIILNVLEIEEDRIAYNPAIIVWFDNKGTDQSFILNTDVYFEDKLQAINVGIGMASTLCGTVLDSIEVIDQEGNIIEEIAESSLIDEVWKRQNAPSTLTIQ